MPLDAVFFEDMNVTHGTPLYEDGLDLFTHFPFILWLLLIFSYDK